MENSREKIHRLLPSHSFSARSHALPTPERIHAGKSDSKSQLSRISVRRVHSDWRSLGSSPNLSDLWQNAVLRLLQKSTRASPLRRDGPCSDQFGRIGRRMAVVFCRSAAKAILIIDQLWRSLLRIERAWECNP